MAKKIEINDNWEPIEVEDLENLFIVLFKYGSFDKGYIEAFDTDDVLMQKAYDNLTQQYDDCGCDELTKIYLIKIPNTSQTNELCNIGLFNGNDCDEKAIDAARDLFNRADCEQICSWQGHGLTEAKKKKKKPYSSITYSTGYPALDIKHFNKCMGTDGLGDADKQGPQIIGDVLPDAPGYYSGEAAADAGTGEAAGDSGAGMAEKLEITEDKIYVGKLKQELDLPPEIHLLNKNEVEHIIDNLEPEEPFEVGYVNPVYFYKELWDYLPIYKCTEMTGYTGVDFSTSEDEVHADKASRIANAKAEIEDAKVSGPKQVGSNADYSLQNKLVKRGNRPAVSQDEPQNTILFYPISAAKVCYFVKLPTHPEFIQITAAQLEKYIYQELEKIKLRVPLATAKSKVYNTLYGQSIQDIDRETRGDAAMLSKYIYKYNRDKHSVRALYTTQLYYISTDKETKGRSLGGIMESIKNKVYWLKEEVVNDDVSTLQASFKDILAKVHAFWKNDPHKRYEVDKLKDAAKELEDSFIASQSFEDFLNKNYEDFAKKYKEYNEKLAELNKKLERAKKDYKELHQYSADEWDPQGTVGGSRLKADLANKYRAEAEELEQQIDTLTTTAKDLIELADKYKKEYEDTLIPEKEEHTKKVQAAYAEYDKAKQEYKEIEKNLKTAQADYCSKLESSKVILANIPSEELVNDIVKFYWDRQKEAAPKLQKMIDETEYDDGYMQFNAEDIEFSFVDDNEDSSLLAYIDNSHDTSVDYIDSHTTTIGDLCNIVKSKDFLEQCYEMCEDYVADHWADRDYYESLENHTTLTEAKRLVKRYYVRPQNIFCSNKEEILKALVEVGDENCSVYSLKSLSDHDDVHLLTPKDIIYYYDDGILYDKNHVKVMDYDLFVKHEEERKKFRNIDTVSDAAFEDEYEDRLTDADLKDKEIKVRKPTHEDLEAQTLCEAKITPDFKDQVAKKVFNQLYATRLSPNLIGKSVYEQHDSRDSFGNKTGSKSGSLYYIEKVYVDDHGDLAFMLSPKYGKGNGVSVHATTFLFGGKDENGYKYSLEFWDRGYAPELLNLLNTWLEDYKAEAKVANANLRKDSHRNTRKMSLASVISAYKDNEEVKNWLMNNVESIVFRVPHSESGVPSDFVSEKDIEKCDYEYNEIISTIKDIRDGDIEFRELDDANEKTRPDLIFSIADVKFKDFIENAPESVKKFLADCKAASRSQNKQDTYEEHSKVISSLYVGMVIAGLFDNMIHFMERSKDNAEHELDQDFPDIDAYGEVLKEGKEKAMKFTCCICGEESEGYGNNPAPVKEDGKCCDACNRKFVIPARLELSAKEAVDSIDKE